MRTFVHVQDGQTDNKIINRLKFRFMKAFGFITLVDRADVSYPVQIEAASDYSITVRYFGTSVDVIRHLSDNCTSFIVGNGFWCIIPMKNVVSYEITKVEE